MEHALSHITVLDLSRVLAGPWAGQVFADLGRRSSKSNGRRAATIPARGARHSCGMPRAERTPQRIPPISYAPIVRR
jgi:crotonobetainyl-CoA:carnitine CoA-transferase CaiB-like acyl-CoA transferase